MNNLFLKRFGHPAKSIIRNLRNIHRSATIKDKHYEDGGRTILTVLNKRTSEGLLIDSCNRNGFTLSSGAFIVGPIILFPRAILSWDIASSKYMDTDSLCLFSVLEPKLKIVVIGLDSDKYSHNAPFIINIRDYMKKLDIAVEILPVTKACTVYNFLNGDNINVAAALIPPMDMPSIIDTQKLQDVKPPPTLTVNK